MSVSTFGAHRASWLYSGVGTLWRAGFESLAVLVAAFSIVLPIAFLTLLVAVLGGLHFGVRGPLGKLYRWAVYLRPWMMLEVYLVGCFVAYSRLRAIAPVDVGLGGWCLVGATFALLLALTQLDDRTVWEALPVKHPDARPAARARGRPDERSDERPTAGPTERTGNVLSCTVCDLIVSNARRGKACPRCGATLRSRKPNAIQLTAALVVAGYLLYIPANLLPVLTIMRFGREEQNTIMSGVFELIQEHLWPLALIVFVASIVLPLMKLSALTWMLIATRRRSSHALVGRTRLYRVIDLVGRWSNIDVFMTSVLVAILQFGAVTAVHAADGLVAFAAVVVLTMVATLAFDSRLMWDAARSVHD
jgi:paraquat-inducible protein A